MQSYYPPPVHFAPRPAPRPVETTAVLSLVFGILSIVCAGFLSGVPALILGIVARKRIRQGNGAVGGHGLAVGGLVTGSIGSVLSLIVTALIVIGAWVGDQIPDPDGPPAAVDVSAPAKSFAKVELHPAGGTLGSQLKREAVIARALGQRPAAMLHAPWCMPCKELERDIDRSKGKGLEGTRLLMIDVDEFDDELEGVGLAGHSVPSVYHIDASGRGAGAPHVGAGLDDLRAFLSE